jgi:hypothetical protein
MSEDKAQKPAPEAEQPISQAKSVLILAAIVFVIVGSVVAWRMLRQTPPAVVKIPRGQITRLALNHAGDKVAVSGWAEDPVWLVDAATGAAKELPWVTVVPGRKQIDGLAFSSDDKRVVAVDHDGTLYCWDVTTGATQPAPSLGPPGAVFTFALSPTGDTVAEIAKGGVVLCSTSTGKRDVIDPKDRRSVSFLPSGEVVAVYDGVNPKDLSCELFSVITRQSISDSRDAFELSHADGSVRVKDLPSQKERWAIQQAHLYFFGADPQGKLVATYGEAVELRSAATGKLIQTLAPQTSAFPGCSGLAFSADGRVLAVGRKLEIELWKVGR